MQKEGTTSLGEMVPDTISEVFNWLKEDQFACNKLLLQLEKYGSIKICVFL